MDGIRKKSDPYYLDSIIEYMGKMRRLEGLRRALYPELSMNEFTKLLSEDVEVKTEHGE